jgi:hypothetical protein
MSNRVSTHLVLFCLFTDVTRIQAKAVVFVLFDGRAIEDNESKAASSLISGVAAAYAKG